jgi:hypothetical protein
MNLGHQIYGSTIDLIFDQSNDLGQPVTNPNAFVSRLVCQSPRAICSALNMQSSLDGIPHRAQRSQSPQANSGARHKDTAVPPSLLNVPRIDIALRIFLSHQ